MQLDSSESISIASDNGQEKEKYNKIQPSDSMKTVRVKESNYVAEAGKTHSASEGENLSSKQVYILKGSSLQPVELQQPLTKSANIYSSNQSSWCYLITHHTKVDKVESELTGEGGFNCFIHRTSHYSKKEGSNHVNQTMKETISGLLFVQGAVKDIQNFLDERFIGCYLAKNCMTGKPAIIPNSQMVPFMHIAETNPDRIRMLLKPFQQYAKDNTLLRIVSGPLSGMEGYVLRIGRDRSLVMNIGGHAVAIQGVHAEMFEKV